MKSLKTTAKHIRRSPYQALAAIFIMMLTFLAISVFSFIVFGTSVAVKYFESKPQVTAFFKDDAKQTDIDALEQSLTQTGKISMIQLISKKQALEIYRKQVNNDPLLMDLVSEDILPASLNISTYNIQDLGGIADTLKNSPLVLKVNYYKDVVPKII